MRSIAILLTICVLAARADGALASPGAAIAVRADVPLLQSARVLRPAAPSVDLHFQGPSGVPVDATGNYLVIAHAVEAAAPVTAAVSVNGERLTTDALQPGSDGQLKVVVPGALVRPGDNTASVEVVTPSCSDGVDWTFTILPTSSAHYALTRTVPDLAGDTLALSTFPEPIAYRGGQRVPVTIVIPHDPAPQELSAALTISAGLGSAGYASNEISIRTAGQVPSDGLAGRHSILIGSAARNAWVDAAWATPSGSAGLKLFPSPWAPGYAALAVTGEGDPLVWAATTISSPDLRANLGSASASVAAPPALEARSTEDVISLVGNDARVAPPGSPLVLRPFLPQLGEGAEVTLNIRASGESPKPVRFNGVDVGDIDASGGVLEVPSGLAHPGRNTIEVGQAGDACGPRGFALLPGSALGVKVGNLDEQPYLPAFSDLPYPFSGGDVYFVVPPDEGPLDAAAGFAAYLGETSPAGSAVIHGSTPATLPEGAAGGASLVLVDQADSNPLIAEASAGLLYYVHPGHALYNRDDTAVESVRGVSTIGLLEFVPSPFNPERSALVISATDPTMLRRTVDAVATAAPDGNIAFVREDGSVTSMSSNTPETLSFSNADDYPEDTIARVIVAAGIVAIGLLLLQLLGGSRRGRAYR